VELLEVRALLSGGLTGAEPEVYLPGSLDSTPDGTVLLGQPGNSDRGGLDGPLTAGQSALTAKTSQQPDDYPLPPARGPKLRGDLEAQPAAMALLLPLNDSPQVLVPTLLTFSGRGRENEGSAAVSLANLGEPAKTGPVAERTALALNASLNPLDFMLLDLSQRTSPNRREINAPQDDGLLAQAGADSSQGLFLPRHRQALGQGESGARQVTENSAADAVEDNLSSGQRSGHAGPDASAWVASVEIRTSESFTQPEEQRTDGAGESVMLPAESISEGAIDTAEPALADPRTAIRTGRLGAAQSMVALLLASSAGLVYRYGRAVERTTRDWIRRSRFIQS